MLFFLLCVFVFCFISQRLVVARAQAQWLATQSRRLSTVPSPPSSSADTSKSTRPKRHFLRFFRRSSKSSKTKAAETKTAPVLLPIGSTTTPSTTTPSTTSQSSKPPTRSSVTYSFALQGTPSILCPTTKATETTHNTNDSIQQIFVSTTEYKDALIKWHDGLSNIEVKLGRGHSTCWPNKVGVRHQAA